MKYAVELVDLGVANVGPTFDARQTWVVYAGPEGAPEEEHWEIGVVEPTPMAVRNSLPYQVRLYTARTEEPIVWTTRDEFAAQRELQTWLETEGNASRVF